MFLDNTLNIINKKKIINNRQNKNINIELLRMILCFWIVTVHTFTFKNKKFPKIIDSKFHVPSFMVISFFFFHKSLYTRNINKIKARFEKLLFPYFIWPIVILIINNLLLLMKFEGIFDRKLTIYDLILSFVYGRHINAIFWFQFDLLFVSLLFSIISFIFKKKFLMVVNLFFLVSYYLQYSGINYKYFSKYNNENYRSIGSIVEMIPFNVTGMILCHFNIINKLREKKFYTIGICIIIIYFLLQLEIFTNIHGIRFPGIHFNIAGTSLFILFYILPTEYIKNIQLLKMILFFTNYTGGIYYLHFIFFIYLKKKFIFIKDKSFKGTIIIYCLNFLFCLIGYKLFYKYRLKYLFI